MLPDHVNIILLSATVPNAKEFADWVGVVAYACHPCLYMLLTPSRTQSNKEERHLCHLHREAAGAARALPLCRSRDVQNR